MTEDYETEGQGSDGSVGRHLDEGWRSMIATMTDTLTEATLEVTDERDQETLRRKS